MQTLHLHNGRIIAPYREIRDIFFHDGKVAGEARDALGLDPSDHYDLEGDYLIPGLVELHTDNLEKHFIPRAGVNWPIALSSVVAHDMHMVGAGVTTVFDAITVGEPGGRRHRKELFGVSLEGIENADKANLLRAQHFLHLRCELAGDDVQDSIEPLLENPRVRLFSVMDHTPGQRQWHDIERYKVYHSLQDAPQSEIDARVDSLLALQAKNVGRNLAAITEMCRQLRFPLASHDDTTSQHVEENAALGVRISEFPTTLEAAQAAKEHGLAVVMGAPNVVRRGSHSGNVAAVDLAREGLLDILSSDYMPASLLHAAFLLPELTGMPLQKALETVTINPAKAVGLHDRGALEPGKLADAVQVRLVDGVPVVRAVWRQGQRVL